MSTVECLFLGTGTSAGVPMIGCHCPVCSSTDPHDKRTRPSVLISYGPTRVLIDTTPELRIQCLAQGVQQVDAVVFTHGHADHIMGLDDCRRFNTLKGGPLDVWADQATHEVLSRCFGYAFQEPRPQMKLYRPHLVRRVVDSPFDIGGVTWTPITLFHGDAPILGYRVGHLAYCTDVSRIPEESFAQLRDLDVLVLDGLQHTPHATHFSLGQARDAAARIAARQTLFTHIAHGLAHEQTNHILPDHMRLACDGQRVTARL